MTRHAFVVVCVLAAALGSVHAQTPAVASRSTSGVWAMGIIARGDTNWSRITLGFDRDSVRGEAAPPARSPIRGRVRGDSVELALYFDSSVVRARFRGAFREGRMTGTGVTLSRSGEVNDSVAWIAYVPSGRLGPPRAHSFEAQVFHRRFSAAIPPALRIFPGDTVRTKTVDAGGTDWTGVRRSNGGNPQTGPFYIEGALPGDVIVVHLHRVRLNRDYAIAGQSIVGSAITPGYASGLTPVNNFNSRWKLDRQRGVATLERPTPALERFEIPLRPMMGCIGVAPAQKQSIRTQDSGPFGGNMDYNEIREGTSVYLPVYEPGALLFIGDGHAAQGDGELTGDALETSMDVEFSVELLPNQSIGTPRAQNSEYLMSIGIAGDLQEALRVATSDLARWLTADHKLNAAEVASILGTVMRYDVADMVGTQMSIVAKVPRSAIAKLQAPK
jgi:amidase